MDADSTRLVQAVIEGTTGAGGWLRRSLLVPAVCFLLAACAGLKTHGHSEVFFSPLLSPDDIQQIKLLVAAKPNIQRPVWQITTDENRADRATVYTGRWSEVGDKSDYFQVEKRHGRWKIISPISHDRLKRIITVS